MISYLTMPWLLQLKWLAVRLLLLAAKTVAWLLRWLPKFRKPTPGPPVLPQFDDSDRRLAESIAALHAYELMPVTEKLQLDIAWPHRTFRELPHREEYTWPMVVAKGLLLLALRPNLDCERRWSRPSQLPGRYRLLGTPWSLPFAEFSDTGETTRDQDDTRRDRFFGRLRTHGPNPVFLRGGADRTQLLKRGLLAAHIDRLEAKHGPVGEWFYVDYIKMLQGIEPADERFLAPAMALFRRTSSGLMPIAIQLDSALGPEEDEDEGKHWTSGRSPVLFEPDGSPAWKLARLFFNSADMLVHEVVAHFSWTHVIAETLALCTARCLSWRHPIRRLLGPHLASSLNQNHNAAPLLIKDGGLFDRVFVGGNAKHKLLEWGHENWTYQQMVLPLQLAERGVDSLGTDGTEAEPTAEGYPMRGHGMRVWNVTRAYAGSYIEQWYGDDEERLRNDREVRSWSIELRQALGHGGFPEINDIETLVEVVTAALFNPVAHNIVNALQYDVFGVPGIAPVALRVPVPTDPNTVDHHTLNAALPDVGQTLNTIRATYGFSFRYDKLGSHVNRTLPRESRRLGSTFQSQLRKIAREIAAQPVLEDEPPRVISPRRLANAVDA